MLFIKFFILAQLQVLGLLYCRQQTSDLFLSTTWMAVSTVQKITTYFVSSVYIMAGAFKFPIIASVYSNMKKQFEVYCTVLPTKAFGVDSITFMYGVGAAEFLLGIGLLLGSRKIKVMCTQGLMFIMAGAVYTLLRIKDYGQAPVPAIMFSSLCYLCYSYGNNQNLKKME